MDKIKKQLLQATINYGSMPMDKLERIIADLCEACK